MVAALAAALLTDLVLALAAPIAATCIGPGASATTARGDEAAPAHSTVSQFWLAGKPLSLPLVWWRHGPMPRTLRGVRFPDASIA